MKNFITLKNRIKKNEGFRSIAYKDSLGFMTIGYGHLIKKNEKKYLNQKFSKKHLSEVFDKDFQQALSDFKKNYKRNKFPKNVEEVFIEMIFQIGIQKQKKFYKILKHIKNKNLFMAALEMKNSLWNKQTPKRVDILTKILLNTEYEKKRQ